MSNSPFEEFLCLLLNSSMLNCNPHLKGEVHPNNKKKTTTTKKLTVFSHLPLVVSDHADTVVSPVNSFLSKTHCLWKLLIIKVCGLCRVTGTLFCNLDELADVQKQVKKRKEKKSTHTRICNDSMLILCIKSKQKLMWQIEWAGAPLIFYVYKTVIIRKL